MTEQFYVREKWHDLNDQALDLFKQNGSDQKLYLYPDMHVSLLETLWSLSRQFLTKRKVYVIKGMST